VLGADPCSVGAAEEGRSVTPGVGLLVSSICTLGGADGGSGSPGKEVWLGDNVIFGGRVPFGATVPSEGNSPSGLVAKPVKNW